MALTTVTISGRLPLPDESVLQGSYVEFTLTDTDRQSSDVAVAATVTADISGAGAISAQLWPNSLGERQTRYRVVVHLVGPDRRSFRVIDLGLIEVPVGGGQIANLLPLRPPASDTYLLHKGDSAILPVTMLDRNRRPANITDSAVTAWLERGGVQTPIGASKANAATGLIELTITAAVSASLALGTYTAVIRLAVGQRVNTLRGIIKII